VQLVLFAFQHFEALLEVSIELAELAQLRSIWL